MATLRFDNPFHDLWVTEILDPSAFVEMFSDKLVSDAEALFSTGNIVLKGRQGSGKSMLLTLLETSTRVAYAKKNKDYPVPAKQRHFISAGVQLTQESASLVAARASEIPSHVRQQTIAANFADYLNALLSRDLLRNTEYLFNEQRDSKNLLPEVSVDLSKKTVSRFFKTLLKSDSWLDVLPKDCITIQGAIEAMDSRLRAHRLYANGNVDDLPEHVRTTRASAGVPMAELAFALRESGILPKQTLVLLRVDQHEELFELERSSDLGNVFRRVINSALARRDPRIAYRMGTRHYAWTAELSSWGSGAPLEEERDYSVIDLDNILRKGEHTQNWKFPDLAKDVVIKRLEFAGFQLHSDPMDTLFGNSLNAQERARRYTAKSINFLKMDDSWAPEWIQYLNSLWDKGEPLDAKFGEAWLRQKSQVESKVAEDGTLACDKPWRRSPWWAKERNEIALLQLAGDRQQALVWSGQKQVIDLAGHNILAFMTVCKMIWGTWQRRNPREAERVGTLPNFSIEDQVIGITEASQTWFRKIRVGQDADRRIRLVSALGSWFRRRMLNDRRLSYPGHNGFSLRAWEVQLSSPLMDLIKVCRDHGDLLESPHTTRNKDQDQRVKWYLHPLLCPLFRIPHVRTKEPVYTSLDELQTLFAQQRRTGPVGDDEIQINDQLHLPGI